MVELTQDIWGNPMEENRRLAKDFRAIEEDWMPVFWGPHCEATR